VQEVVFVIAGDGVHGEYDRFGTLALRPHYHIISIVIICCVRTGPGAITVPGGKKKKKKCQPRRGGDLHHSSDLVRFNPINL
jgi:hypothetical protein